MKTFVLGDVQGAARAQALERNLFRSGLDRLMQLGDVADGWPETPRRVAMLPGIPNSSWPAARSNHSRSQIEQAAPWQWNSQPLPPQRRREFAAGA